MLKRINDWTVWLLKILLVALFTLLALDVLWGVASRHLLGGQASWSEEVARLLMVWLALLGAALVARENKHLGMDTLARSLSPDAARLATILTQVVILSFAAWVMAWGGFELVSERFTRGQLLPSLGISKAWFYLALPISGVLITLYSVETLWSLLRRESASPQEGREEAGA